MDTRLWLTPTPWNGRKKQRDRKVDANMVVAGGRAGVDETHVTCAEWRSHGSLSSLSPAPPPVRIATWTTSLSMMTCLTWSCLCLLSTSLSFTLTLNLLDNSRSAQAGLRFMLEATACGQLQPPPALAADAASSSAFGKQNLCQACPWRDSRSSSSSHL